MTYEEARAFLGPVSKTRFIRAAFKSECPGCQKLIAVRDEIGAVENGGLTVWRCRPCTEYYAAQSLHFQKNNAMRLEPCLDSATVERRREAWAAVRAHFNR